MALYERPHILREDIYERVENWDRFPGEFVAYLKHESKKTNDFSVDFEENYQQSDNVKQIAVKESIVSVTLPNGKRDDELLIFQRVYSDGIRTQDVVISSDDSTFSKWNRTLVDYPNVDFLVAELLELLHEHNKLSDEARLTIRLLLDYLGKFLILEFNNENHEKLSIDTPIFSFKEDEDWERIKLNEQDVE